MSSNEIVKHRSDVCRGRGGVRSSIGFSPAINALAQVARLAYGFERGPIRPSTDSVAMFAAAQTVVENKSTSASGRYANTEAARCFGALDHGARKVGDAVPLRRDRQPLDCFFVEFLPAMVARVRTMSAQSIYLSCLSVMC